MSWLRSKNRFLAVFQKPFFWLRPIRSVFRWLGIIFPKNNFIFPNLDILPYNFSSQKREKFVIFPNWITQISPGNCLTKFSFPRFFSMRIYWFEKWSIFYFSWNCLSKVHFFWKIPKNYLDNVVHRNDLMIFFKFWCFCKFKKLNLYVPRIPRYI